MLGQWKGVSPVADGGNSERTRHSLGTGSKSSDGCGRRFLGSNRFLPLHLPVGLGMVTGRQTHSHTQEGKEDLPDLEDALRARSDTMFEGILNYLKT